MFFFLLSAKIAPTTAATTIADIIPRFKKLYPKLAFNVVGESTLIETWREPLFEAPFQPSKE